MEKLDFIKVRVKRGTLKTVKGLHRPGAEVVVTRAEAERLVALNVAELAARRVAIEAVL